MDEETFNDNFLYEEVISIELVERIIKDEAVVIEDESISIELVENMIEDEVVVEKMIEDEVVVEKMIEDEVIEDEVIEDEVIEDEVVEDGIIVEKKLVIEIVEEKVEEKVEEIVIVIKPQNQDFNQRMNAALSILLELYRVITCSLLILFVPQNCNDMMCTPTQNLETDDTFYKFALVINFITLFSFCPLYYLEIKRENRLIKYLDVNLELTNDDKGVENILTLLPSHKTNKIIQIDSQYQKFAYVIIGLYGFNVLCSTIVIFQYYLGSQTITVLITFVLFITTKLINVYSVANTTKNVFLSAYLKTNIQYNDIDQKFKVFDCL